MFCAKRSNGQVVPYGQGCPLLDVHPSTIRRWEAEGELRCEWTPGSKERRIPESEIHRIPGTTAKENTVAVALYGCVSGHGHGDGLETQAFCLAAKYISRYGKTYTITEIGSGLNIICRRLRKLMDMVRSRSVRAIAITYKDRLTRFGYEYLDAFLEGYSVPMLVLYPDEEQTAEDEPISDMIALVTSFARRLYGRRSRKVREPVQCVRKQAVH
jgi:predicted site-specific integrase-resolvase